MKTWLIVLLSFASFVAFIHGNSAAFSAGKDKDKGKGKEKKEGCDTTKLVRTSNDSMILKKYLKVYQRMGGVCYIIHLQQMTKLRPNKNSDSLYTVKVKQAGTSQERVDWATYLFCPIGKPNGTVTLLAESGDTIQQCTYKDEKKNGLMIWWKAHNEIMTVAQFNNDVQKIRAVDTMLKYSNRY